MISKFLEYVRRNHIIMYLFLGALTTVVNYTVYFTLYNLFNLSASVSNVIAWGISVVVAFITNKPLVFESYDWSFGIVRSEIARFIGCRIGSGAVETIIIYITVDLLCWDGNIMKLFISVLVILLNYIGSKLFVFRKRKEA